MCILKTMKDHLINIYDLIKEFEQIPLRNFSDDFDSAPKQKPVRAKRTNQVKVEDLRPPRKQD